MAIQSIDLTNLNGERGYTIRGDEFDQLGLSVSELGDVNGDGIDDIIIGRDNQGNSGVGESYVVFGQAGGRPDAFLDVADLTAADGIKVRLSSSDERAGSAVSDAGDFNGDGRADFIVGVPGLEGDRGGAYIVYGQPNLGSSGVIDLSTLDDSQALRIEGVNVGDFAGSVVSSAGDINNDGFDDVLIGAPDANGQRGVTFVLFGGSSDDLDGEFDLDDLNGANGFIIEGEAVGDQLGRSLSRAGDVNNDGIEDFLMGAPGATGFDSRRQTPLAGRSYLIFGDEAIGASGQVELQTLDRTDGIAFVGLKSNDLWGTDVSNLGDVNNDGIDDVVLGSPGRRSILDNTLSFAKGGQATVIFGNADPTILNDNLRGPNALRIKGVRENDELGYSVSGVGDVNGDDIDDLLIGTRNAAPDGKAYLVFGRDDLKETGIDLREINGRNGIEINGFTSEDGLALQVSQAGDLNADGINDLLLSAPQANGQGGISFVIYGFQRIAGGPTREGDFLRGSNQDERINARLGQDEVLGRGGDDTLLGAGGDDLLNGGNGRDILRGGADHDTLLGGAGNDRLVGQNGDDHLKGGFGDDILIGGAGKNSLEGGAGNDVLMGGTDNDTMIGGTGSDRFVLKRLGVDVIRDFSSEDKVQVGLLDFGADLSLGALEADQFSLGTAPANASTRFFYDQESRRLWFDGDGSGTQRGRFLLARFNPGTSLSSQDIEVI